MCNRKHRHVGGEGNENKTVREVVNRQRSHVSIINAWDERTRGRELLKMLKRPSHLLSKPVSHVSAALTVPSSGFA